MQFLFVKARPGASFLFFLVFREAILQTNYAVKGIRIFGILAEVAGADELELFAGCSIGKGRLNDSARKLGKRIGIEEIEIGLA